MRDTAQMRILAWTTLLAILACGDDDAPADADVADSRPDTTVDAPGEDAPGEDAPGEDAPGEDTAVDAPRVDANRDAAIEPTDGIWISAEEIATLPMSGGGVGRAGRHRHGRLGQRRRFRSRQ